MDKTQDCCGHLEILNIKHVSTQSSSVWHRQVIELTRQHHSIVDAPIFPPIIYLYSCSPHPLYSTQACFSPTACVVAFLLILPDVDLMLFITFFVLMKPGFH